MPEGQTPRLDRPSAAERRGLGVPQGIGAAGQAECSCGAGCFWLEKRLGGGLPGEIGAILVAIAISSE